MLGRFHIDLKPRSEIESQLNTVVDKWRSHYDLRSNVLEVNNDTKEQFVRSFLSGFSVKPIKCAESSACAIVSASVTSGRGEKKKTIAILDWHNKTQNPVIFVRFLLFELGRVYL